MITKLQNLEERLNSVLPDCTPTNGKSAIEEALKRLIPSHVASYASFEVLDVPDYKDGDWQVIIIIKHRDRADTTTCTIAQFKELGSGKTKYVLRNKKPYPIYGYSFDDIVNKLVEN